MAAAIIISKVRKGCYHVVAVDQIGRSCWFIPCNSLRTAQELATKHAASAMVS
jgi:hypothetical protein